MLSSVMMLNLTRMAFCSEGVFRQRETFRGTQVVPRHLWPAGPWGLVAGEARGSALPHSIGQLPGSHRLPPATPRWVRLQETREQSPVVTLV